jgi:hypothetical protein
MSPAMAQPDAPLARVLLRLALALCCLSAAAACWEFLALQMPDSPFHLGVLGGPIAQLRNFSAALGIAALALTPVWPHLYPEGAGRLVLGLMLVATSILLGALLYAASQGLVGVQLLDPRPDARLVAYARAAGHGLLLCALALVFLRALRSR